ncbi:MAG: EI24 domain-containing protein [Alphaproteobacteria bacterium]
MLSELRNAFKDVFSKQIIGLVWLTALTTLLVFIVLFCLFVFGMSFFELTGSPELEKMLEIFSYIIFFIMSLMLFPSVATFVSGFFIDSVVDRTAKKNNISGLRNVPLSESVVLSGVVALKGVVLSAVLIPVILILGLIPFGNLVPIVLYYRLNGRLLAREYFFAVALRYLPKDKADEVFDRNSGYWIKSGIVIAVLMTIPVVNIISPLIAMAFMQRLFLKKQQEQR